MGALALVDTPTNPECHNTVKSHSRAEALAQLSLDTSIPASQNQSITSLQQTNTSFAEFLVPGLQPKAWEDWQVADELDPFTTGSQEWGFNHTLLPFQFGLDGIWEPADAVAMGLPADQAYDEFVFDLTPSNFATPTTVNVADLFATSASLATSVSPLELTMPSSVRTSGDNDQELALANLYGFTDHDAEPSDGNLGSDLSDAESSPDSDDDQAGDSEDDSNICNDELASIGRNLSKTTNTVAEKNGCPDHNLENGATVVLDKYSEPMASSKVHCHPKALDLNKRHMEEDLAARISSDLGPEHMPGLFKILKRSSGHSSGDDEEDEEMEVDLSRLDETTLVELHHYVEACCMQTVGTILAAEERERRRALAQERERQCQQRTPDLSPCQSISSSPSPSYPSSPIDGYESGNNRTHSTSTSAACTMLYEHSGVEEQVEAQWMAAQHKSKRKRATKNDPTCMGGGGTGKGRRKPRLEVVLTDMDLGEDDEIDIVGF
ncbi:hypothetical protein B0O80DRAFT_528078 [Mortierella sp. GBAus27b]|nr:hypothetical protein BGX31_002599 [Mortierella sp. GBA43]KAI8356475.1 hypothetical protein B0O80DRAFT_528078 [Mortierella sp. GBAus27b]